MRRAARQPQTIRFQVHHYYWSWHGPGPGEQLPDERLVTADNVVIPFRRATEGRQRAVQEGAFDNLNCHVVDNATAPLLPICLCRKYSGVNARKGRGAVPSSSAISADFSVSLSGRALGARAPGAAKKLSPPIPVTIPYA
jgi:hypothetical protein